jgi:hypothetical protein
MVRVAECQLTANPEPEHETEHEIERSYFIMSPIDDFNASLCNQFTPDFHRDTCQYYDQAENEKVCGYCKKKELYRCLADCKRIIPLSYSSVSDYLTCHHLYYLKAIRGIQINKPKLSSPLKKGMLWDRVLQNLLSGQKIYDINATITEYEMDIKDVTIVRAIYRAYKELEIVTEPNGNLQAKIDLTIPFDMVWGDKSPVEMLVNGFYDRKYSTYFVENKLSGRPLNYEDVYFIQSQVGVYFLADPSLEYCIMEIVRTPDLKSTGKNKDESVEAYGERVYQDVISRPTHYFLGYDIKTHKYGKKYYRSEFNLEELKSRFIHVFREIYNTRWLDGWYRNDRVCNSILPGIACDMTPICRNGNMSEDNYTIREKVIGKW